jgi:hypothetical protein
MRCCRCIDVDPDQEWQPGDCKHLESGRGVAYDANYQAENAAMSQYQH